MRTLRAWAVRLVALFRPDHLDADLRAEIDSHLQHQTDANIQAGMPRRRRGAPRCCGWAVSSA